jgi:hypothetical protein
MGGFLSRLFQKNQTQKGALPLKNSANQGRNNANANNIFIKKIGSNIYEVHVHFSQTSRDSFHDKLLRLVKHDIAKNKKAS